MKISNPLRSPLAAVRGLLLAGSVFVLAACGTAPVEVASDDDLDEVLASIPERQKPKMVPAPRGAGYYQDDGPHAMIPADLDHVPDAIPRLESLYRPSLRPYRVMGQRFEPMTELEPYREVGHASWYGRKFHGRKTAIGETYDMYAMTAAHPTLPLPSYVRVTNTENGRAVIVRVNDRGPFLRGRLIDLSYAAAHRLGFINAGSARVEVELLLPEDIAVAEAAVREIQPVYVANARPGDEIASGAVRASALAPSLASGQRVPYLQLGAFDTPANAAQLMVRAREELQMLTEQLHLIDGGGRYRLQIGPFASVDEARSFAGRVLTTLELQPYLVMR
ncbi:MAG: septal ring lytic transglycosylase RlpA family protein [Azoarcus sp.]|nr:septal ring lytic transglycosylase RlpA family protein [Azoarcus sp.]